MAELRARVMSGPPESPRAWIDRAALFAPGKVAAELVAAGVASPLERRFARRFTLSVDARAEAAARERAEQDPVLGALLQSWPLPPATHTLPPVGAGDPRSGRPHAADGPRRLRRDADGHDRRGRGLVREVAVRVQRPRGSGSAGPRTCA